MKTDTAVSARRAAQSEAVERFIHTTQRTDWDPLLTELFERVIHFCPYGIAVITKHKILRWHRLILRTNEMFEPADVTQFIRRYMRVAHYDGIFKSTAGMEHDERYDLYKIISPNLGLPVKSLVYGIQHVDQADLKALLVFGGERIEGHMERSLEIVQRILAASPTTAREPVPGPGPDDYGSYGELIAALRGVNVRDLDKMDVREISDLVNGLDAVIEYSPASLRAKYRALNDYLLQRGRR